MNKYTEQDHRFASLRNTLNAHHKLLGPVYEDIMDELVYADEEEESMKMAIMTDVAKKLVRKHAYLNNKYNSSIKIIKCICFAFIGAGLLFWINQ